MGDTDNLELQLNGWYTDAAPGEEPILFSVSGLSSSDNCIIAYGGMGLDEKKKYYLHWHRSGLRLRTPAVAYNSPQEALKAVAELREQGV